MQQDSLIPTDRFDNPCYLAARLDAAPNEVRGALKTVLTYLYESSGPKNLSRKRFKAAQPFLDMAEKIVARWLLARTNGSLRSTYGAGALLCARNQRYRCHQCGWSDVRALEIDHVEGRKNRDSFACLCSNCHAIKSRAKDWTGSERAAEE